MLRNSRGIAALFLGGSKSRLHWLLKTEIAPLTYAALATTTKSAQAEDQAVNEKNLLNLTDVSTIIQSGIDGGSSVKAYQAIQVLSDWVEVKKVDFKNDIEKDENFGRLLALLERDSQLNNPLIVLNGLKNLHKLGLSDDAYVIQSMEYALFRTVGRRWVIYLRSSSQCAENHLLWNVRKVSIPVLLSILRFQIQHQNTELQKKVLKETIDTVQRRWVEVKGAKEIQIIYSNHELFSLDFLGRLDDRTIELAEEMSYAELSGIFCALGTVKRRATPVLRALAFHMAKQEDKLPPKQLSNILFAMHSLSFPDQVLLEKVGKDLIPQVASITRPPVIGAILFCMGQMRWRQQSLLEVISEWVENNTDACRINDLVSLVLTLACVTYTPTNAENLFTKIISKLDNSSISRETVWLDVVWSLALLGRATNDHISSVLHPSFASKTRSVAQHLRMGIKLKLLNINAVAKLMMPSYNGPFLDTADFRDIIITQSRNELLLSKHVQSMLHNFLPPPKYIQENIQTPLGIFVDCEIAVDQKGKPIPIQDYSDNFGEANSAKPLPEGATKMTVFVWDYKDYTIGSQELTGVNKLAVHLMEKIGYKVVQVPHFEYNMRGKTIKNIQYLENKIKEAAGVS
ncbi:FAST kinase domain-containing protein 4 isoform X1 [Macrobrachium rosenbergii]|uniref:FAST kinase domain-containing protein 4 isoform X1 n=1 Tax=Macrobrachium rosenbergii TaxID=79674 RepID=UPI0034D4CB2A